MFELTLIRHGESVWNKENLFTGWTDVDLSEDGKIEAKEAGAELKRRGYEFDVCFTSYLKRAIHTLNIALDEMDRAYLPVIKSWKLNERHYGALQGLNKSETAMKYGEGQVKIWRRSYDIAPPAIEVSDERNPANQKMYADANSSELPLCESLKDTVARVIPYFESDIKPLLKQGKKVVIAAHGNSLRALVMYLENMSEEEIIGVNIPTAVPLSYKLDDNFKVIEKQYLADESKVAAKMQKVANQGKAK